jgi:hypothetical protein
MPHPELRLRVRGVLHLRGNLRLLSYVVDVECRLFHLFTYCFLPHVVDESNLQLYGH